MTVRIISTCHFLASDWLGPTTKIWNDKQCLNVGMNEPSEPLDLAGCKDWCLSVEGCNAIIRRPNQTGEVEGCVLRACPWPVPTPIWEWDNDVGFYLSTGKIERH